MRPILWKKYLMDVRKHETHSTHRHFCLSCGNRHYCEHCQPVLKPVEQNISICGDFVCVDKRATYEPPNPSPHNHSFLLETNMVKIVLDSKRIHRSQQLTVLQLII